jgi:hypothetical protein
VPKKKKVVLKKPLSKAGLKRQTFRIQDAEAEIKRLQGVIKASRDTVSADGVADAKALNFSGKKPRPKKKKK